MAPIATTRLTEDVLPPDLQDRLKPEFVAPQVLYLFQSSALPRAIYNAGMGYYSRAAIMTGAGAVIGDGKEVPTPEQVAKNIKKIVSVMERSNRTMQRWL